MKRILTLFIFLIVCSGVRAQKQDCSIILNHFLITVDSTTYQALLNSEVLNSDFAFAYERNKNWEGIYIIGQDNYIEIFHPNSISDEYIPVGFTWVCQASLVANCLENYDLPNNDQIMYSSEEDYDYLSVYTQDSSNLMSTCEMNKVQYESWTKKTFHDSLIFQTTDYNSSAESDSSKNHLFKNVTGIQINLNISDSLSVTQYLNLVGYTVESKGENRMKFTNSNDFIELRFSESVEIASISVIYFELNQPAEPKRISVGSSEIIIEGETGKWEINKN